MPSPGDPLRRLPSVSRLLNESGAPALIARHGRGALLRALRETLEDARAEARRGGDTDADPAAILARAGARLAGTSRFSPRRVLNATGILLHTNLGRAPLGAAAARAVLAAATGYTDLELDLSTGERGSRGGHVEPLLRELSGAEAALVANNNAGALLLALDTLARGREVVISRGELVEIGGSFRLPEIIERTGARLHEVGTTNRTHPRDYESAIGPDTALLLKVHRSNFRMEGYTRSVSESELAPIARRAGVPLVVDAGSGTFLDLRPWGLPAEPPVQAILRDGADLVMFSGDKLLGGPQAGIALGRRDLLDRMRRNPLARALRPDKMTLAALSETLRGLRDPEEARTRIPVLRMLALTAAELDRRARRLARLLRAALGPGFRVSVEDGASQLGGGAWALKPLPTRLVAVRSESVPSHKVEERIRAADPPVLARLREGAVLLDPRTLEEADFAAVAAAFRHDFR